METNHEVARVYMDTRRQVIMRHNGQYDEPFDISIPAIKIMMDLHCVQNQRECLGRVVRIWNIIESERRNNEG